ncbi:MAG: hypothetical protein ACFCUE_04575 [Candidatus Bathyarchaeia archaeon]|jgi:DNA-binding Lrp family transcriptional regulator
MTKADDLDEQCASIFMVLMAEVNPITFNRLFEKLEPEMSKPTLIRHLSHLQKNKIIKREKIGKQKVTYAITEKLYNELYKERDFVMEDEELTSLRGEANGSFSIADKVQYILLLLTLNEIDHLRTTLQSILEPKRKYELTLRHLYSKNTVGLLTNYRLLKTLKSNEEIEKALNLVNELEEDFWKKASVRRNIKDIF